MDTLVRNRCPIFDLNLGITPVRSLTIDVLHCLYLGVFNSFAKHVIWMLILAGAWGKRQTNDETIANSVFAIRRDLRGWYAIRASKHPNEKLTRISKFRKGTLGEAADQKLRTKGAAPRTPHFADDRPEALYHR